MTAAAAIAARSPVGHWPFSETTSDITVAGDIPNLYIRTTLLDEDYWFAANSSSGACGGDVAAIANRMYGGACQDFRAPKGGYSWDGIDPFGVEPGQIQTPDRIPLVELPTNLFGSQAFTIVWFGGNMAARHLMYGVGPTAPSELGDGRTGFAPTLWFGGATIGTPGFEEGVSGCWMTVGNLADPDGFVSSSPALYAYIGSGTDIVGAAATTRAQYFGPKGMNALIYDPSKPITERLIIWSDGARSYVDGDETALGAVYTILGSQWPKLFLTTGWNWQGISRYSELDDDGHPIYNEELGGYATEVVHPWRQSYSGALHNLAVFDSALTQRQMADMWMDANSRSNLSSGGCTSWRGAGPTPVITFTKADTNLYTFDASTSIKAPTNGDIISWEWQISRRVPYDDDPPDVPATGVTFSMSETTSPTHITRSYEFGYSVEVSLRIVDSDGLWASTYVVFVPDDDENGLIEVAEPSTVGHVRSTS